MATTASSAQIQALQQVLDADPQYQQLKAALNDASDAQKPQANIALTDYLHSAQSPIHAAFTDAGGAYGQYGFGGTVDGSGNLVQGPQDSGWSPAMFGKILGVALATVATLGAAGVIGGIADTAVTSGAADAGAVAAGAESAGATASEVGLSADVATGIDATATAAGAGTAAVVPAGFSGTAAGGLVSTASGGGAAAGGAGAASTAAGTTGAGATGMSALGSLLKAGGASIAGASQNAATAQQQADQVALQGQTAFQNELMARAQQESKQRSGDLGNLALQSAVMNPRVAPFDTTGGPQYSPQYKSALNSLAGQADTTLAASPTYGTANLPPLTQFQPTQPGALQQVGNWLGPALNVVGSSPSAVNAIASWF